jgi:hypothetical protein
VQPLTRRCPHLAPEDAAQASDPQPVDLDHAAMQVRSARAEPNRLS